MLRIVKTINYQSILTPKKTTQNNYYFQIFKNCFKPTQ